MLKRKPKQPMLIALLAVLMLVVALALIWFEHTRQTAQPTVSIKLSDGEIISIGESKEKLLQDIGSSLRTVNADLYQYPGDPVAPVQVSVYVKDDKVTGLYVTKDRRNKELLTGAGIDSNAAQLALNSLVKLSPIDMSTDKVKRRGYEFTRGNATAYFITPTCGTGDQIVSMLAVGKDYDEVLASFSDVPPCFAGSK